MATTTLERREVNLAVGSLEVHLKEKGTGPPTVVLHHSTGPIWTPFYDQLAGAVTVIAPDLPGYGRSRRHDLLRSPRDLAVLTLQAIDLLDRGPVHLIGLGLGGWVAAEMATMNRQLLASLTLVGAAGIKPDEGDIYDPMMESYLDYMRRGFSSPERCAEIVGAEPDPEMVKLWDFSREMTARITWRPWMWSPSLPVAVAGIRLPALIVWGERDAVVPLECARRYHQLIAGSQLDIVPGVGHIVDLESPEELAERFLRFTAIRKV
jgi:pimeloyl-ACP methyl ester carboxylesterase